MDRLRHYIIGRLDSTIWREEVKAIEIVQNGCRNSRERSNRDACRDATRRTVDALLETHRGASIRIGVGFVTRATRRGILVKVIDSIETEKEGEREREKEEKKKK